MRCVLCMLTTLILMILVNGRMEINEGIDDTFGSFGLLSSTISLRRRFISAIHVANLPPDLISSNFPLSHN
jgi:hypothetical protein